MSSSIADLMLSNRRQCSGSLQTALRKTLSDQLWHGLAGLLISLFLLTLPGCNTTPAAQLQLTCDDAQVLCYRGNSIDRRATRDRYGVRGAIKLNQEYLD